MDQSSKETGHGHLPQVQAEDSQERQPREARIDLVSQDVPRQGGLAREVAAVSGLASATFRGRETPTSPTSSSLSSSTLGVYWGRTAGVENIRGHAVGPQEPGEMSPTRMAKRTSPATS